MRRSPTAKSKTRQQRQHLTWPLPSPYPRRSPGSPCPQPLKAMPTSRPPCWFEPGLLACREAGVYVRAGDVGHRKERQRDREGSAHARLSFFSLFCSSSLIQSDRFINYSNSLRYLGEREREKERNHRFPHPWLKCALVFYFPFISS